MREDGERRLAETHRKAEEAGESARAELARRLAEVEEEQEEGNEALATSRRGGTEKQEALDNAIGELEVVAARVGEMQEEQERRGASHHRAKVPLHLPLPLTLPLP